MTSVIDGQNKSSILYIIEAYRSYSAKLCFVAVFCIDSRSKTRFLSCHSPPFSRVERTYPSVPNVILTTAFLTSLREALVWSWV